MSGVVICGVISFSQHARSPQKGVGDNIINDSFLMLRSNSTCKLRIHVTDLNYLSGDSVSAKGISVIFFLGLSSSWTADHLPVVLENSK